jgi:hypothetical protein
VFDRSLTFGLVFLGSLDQPCDLLAELRSPIAIEAPWSDSGFRFLGVQNPPGRSRNFPPFDVAFAISAPRPEWAVTNKLFRDGRTGCVSGGAGLEAIVSGVAIRGQQRLDSRAQRDDCRILLHEGCGGRWTRGDDRRGIHGRASGKGRYGTT